MAEEEVYNQESFMDFESFEELLKDNHYMERDAKLKDVGVWGKSRKVYWTQE